MQIHELNNFAGTPSSTDYLAIDNSTTTTKIGATGLGVQDKLTVAEANTGTSTASRIVTPKVVHDYVTGEVSDGIDNITTSATETKWASITGGDGSIDDSLDYLADNAIHYKDYSGTTGTTAVNGWYYQDQSLSLPDGAIVVGIFAAYAASQRPLLTQTYSSYTILRVYTAAQNTAYVCRVLYIGGN